MKGTVGSLAAIPLILFFNFFGLYKYIALTFLLLLFAIQVCNSYEANVNNHDSPEVVIDEVVGYAFAMIWMPMTWQAFLIAFIIFRVFDILKPPPISFIDQQVRGGFGVVLDDVVAGVITNIICQFIYTQTTWFGVQQVF
jgi:phosphatidylglycerophosphatase A